MSAAKPTPRSYAKQLCITVSFSMKCSRWKKPSKKSLQSSKRRCTHEHHHEHRARESRPETGRFGGLCGHAACATKKSATGESFGVLRLGSLSPDPGQPVMLRDAGQPLGAEASRGEGRADWGQRSGAGS